MARQLDREGVFKAMPTGWGLQDSDSSQSVALVITFRIIAQYDDGNWVDWSEYEEHEITAYQYIVKKDGQVNAATVENLARAIGWDGNLNLQSGPPEVVCQITVEMDEYNGKSRLKVRWINPGDFVPGPKTVDPAKAQQLSARYGALMRAAAAAAKPKTGGTPKQAPPPAAKKQQAPPPQTDADAPAVTEDDLPFEHRAAAVTGDMPAAHGAGGYAGTREPGAPAPQFVAHDIAQARIDRQIDGAVAVAVEEPYGYLASLGFVEIDLGSMNIDELKAHANLLFSQMQLGEKRMIRAAIDESNKYKLATALRIVMQRIGGRS